MVDRIVLEAAPRTVTGKEVRHLRAQGVVPGVLYGPQFEAMPVQVVWTTLRPVLLQAGGSQVIQLNVEGQEYNALVRDVQRDPLRGDVLHIDFYRVRMDVAIRTDVPIVLIGDTEHITEMGGQVSQETTAITVECLPTNLPAHIELDVSGLKEIGDTILVSGLPQLEGVTYHAAEDDVIVSTSYMRVREEEEEEEVVQEGAEPELVGRHGEEEGEDEV